MDRVFLDANILFSVAYKPTSRLRALWDIAHVTLLSSPYAVAEAELNLLKERPQTLIELQTLLHGVVVSMPQTSKTLPVEVTLVEKDIPILLAAISMEATHLLTGDKLHFGHLFNTCVEGVLVLPPASYLDEQMHKLITVTPQKGRGA